MDWRRLPIARLLGLLTLGLVGATVASVGGVGLLGWGFATLFAVAPAIEALTPLLAWFVAGIALGVPLAVLGFGAAALTMLRSAAEARDGLRRRAGRVAEAYDDELSLLGLGDVVERIDDRDADERAEDRVERLKREYVAGDVDDREFERRLEELVADDEIDANRVLSIKQSVRDREREYERF